MRSPISDVLPILPYLRHVTLEHIDTMSSTMISQTLQGAVLSMTSNVLAQAISSYKDSVLWHAINLPAND